MATSNAGLREACYDSGSADSGHKSRSGEVLIGRQSGGDIGFGGGDVQHPAHKLPSWANEGRRYHGAKRRTLNSCCKKPAVYGHPLRLKQSRLQEPEGSKSERQTQAFKSYESNGIGENGIIFAPGAQGLRKYLPISGTVPNSQSTTV